MPPHEHELALRREFRERFREDAPATPAEMTALMLEAAAGKKKVEPVLKYIGLLAELGGDIRANTDDTYATIPMLLTLSSQLPAEGAEVLENCNWMQVATLSQKEQSISAALKFIALGASRGETPEQSMAWLKRHEFNIDWSELFQIFENRRISDLADVAEKEQMAATRAKDELNAYKGRYEEKLLEWARDPAQRYKIGDLPAAGAYAYFTRIGPTMKWNEGELMEVISCMNRGWRKHFSGHEELEKEWQDCPSAPPPGPYSAEELLTPSGRPTMKLMVWAAHANLEPLMDAGQWKGGLREMLRTLSSLPEGYCDLSSIPREEPLARPENNTTVRYARAQAMHHNGRENP